MNQPNRLKNCAVGKKFRWKRLNNRDEDRAGRGSFFDVAAIAGNYAANAAAVLYEGPGTQGLRRILTQQPGKEWIVVIDS